MSTDLESVVIVRALLALGVASGIVWGRFSERLAIPELLRMLSTPLFTGTLGLVFGFPLSLIVFGAKIRNSPHEGAVAATAISCFAAGMLLGLPAIFGWAVGYRNPPNPRPIAPPPKLERTSP
jgi:hypothetical protein